MALAPLRFAEGCSGTWSRSNCRQTLSVSELVRLLEGDAGVEPRRCKCSRAPPWWGRGMSCWRIGNQRGREALRLDNDEAERREVAAISKDYEIASYSFSLR